MILESLAANRGKSIYCAIDQSDTWTKSETWLAGRDRNERDDTVYFGQQGNFRGFLAAQEGYLTDGESGVTGVSRDLIFEFPEEERRGKKTIRTRVGSGPADEDTCPDHGGTTPPYVDNRPFGTLLCTAYGPADNSGFATQGSTARVSKNRYAGQDDADNRWEVDWRTNVRRVWGLDGIRRVDGTAGARFRSPVQWRAMAEARAIAACQARGGGWKYAKGSADFGPGHNRFRGANEWDVGANHGWFFAWAPHSSVPNYYQSRARESRTWSGVCTKRVRRR